MKDRLLKERCERIKLILTDVDGVMTDGSIFLMPDGGEARVFNVRDGYGIVLAHAAGIDTGIITGRVKGGLTVRAIRGTLAGMSTTMRAPGRSACRS